jgi:hypothetical protein
MYKSLALAQSLAKYKGILHLLVIDDYEVTKLTLAENIKLYKRSELEAESAKLIQSKYKGDKLRWALKPSFLKQLLQANKADRVIYVDNDIYFFNDPSFLFEKLNSSSMLLSPHFFKADPQEEQNWLEVNFRLGLYNAGFIGASKQAIDALEWWENCCAYRMRRSYYRGLFDDQKYLDLLPILFEKVEVLKHRGCNLAGWNDEVNLERATIKFIHFNEFTLKRFGEETSNYHWAFLEYVKVIREFHPNYIPKLNNLSWFKVKNHIIYLIWKVEQTLKI